MALLAGQLCALAIAAPAWAGKRVAIVIGNANYAHASQLANPEADARAMTAMFRRLGFETAEARTNLPLSAMRRALADFELNAEGAEIAAIYYSGHGVQVGGQDYLVPTDAELAREVDIADETVDLNRALRAVSGATRLRLLIVDACRDNPFASVSGRKGMTRGLAPPRETALASTLIAFAASPGEAAVDGPGGGNSPFASALIRRLPTPGLDIELALRMVTRDVNQATGGQQTPYKAGFVVGEALPLVDAEAPSPQVFSSPSPVPTPAPAVAATVPQELASVHPVSPSTKPGPSRAAMLVSTIANAAKPEISVGVAVWSIVPAPQGQPEAIGVKADIDIPELKMHASMILRKNFDASLPASHTIDLRVAFDAGSPIKGIKDIALPLMRRDDPPAADALTGVRVKISDNYFLVGLKRGKSDNSRNVADITERGWFEFPMQLDDDRIAKLSFEKGGGGKMIVAQALKMWK